MEIAKPNQDNRVVADNLDNNIEVLIPSGAISYEKTFRISLVTNPPTMPYGIKSQGNVIDIATENSSISFNKPITIRIAYPSGILNPHDLKAYTYHIYQSDLWEEISISSVDTENRTITIQTSHLSLFTLAFKAANNLNSVKAYPNPFKSRDGHSQIIFTNLTSEATIRIYSIDGTLVKTIPETDGDGQATWDTLNQDGRKVASGIYIYVITNRQGEKKTGKVAIIR